jgi:hypothetical protein
MRSILRMLYFLQLDYMKKQTKLGDYEIQYDTVIDHDAYQYLRISLEVPRTDPSIAFVVLNGKNIGIIRSLKQGRKTLFIGYRYTSTGDETILRIEPSKTIGKIAAAIISDFVQ